jgi:hypothetical protein
MVPPSQCPGLVERAIAAAEGNLAQAYEQWRNLCGLQGQPESHDLDPDLHRSLADGIPQGNEFKTFAESRLWWWRFLEPASPDRLRVFRPTANLNGDRNDDYGRIVAGAFAGNFDESAFYYELRARNEGRNRWEFGVPWPACTLHQRMFLACVWPSKRRPGSWVPGMGNDPRFQTIELRHADLELPNKDLLKLFQKELGRLRQIAGSRPRVRGGSQHAVPWGVLEIADRRHLAGEILNESERSQLNKKLREYGADCREQGLTP